jgi:hypothetical protein
LIDLFWIIVERIGKIFMGDFIEQFEEIIRDNNRAKEIMRLYSIVFVKKSAV